MVSMDRPTVLVVGEGDRMREALLDALEQNGVLAEPCGRDEAQQVAYVAAPDLLLLIGDAAEDGGAAVLRQIAADPTTAMVPIALLSDDTPAQQLGVFRHGMIGNVQRSASVDAMAREIVALARDLPERSGESGGELGGQALEQLTALLSDPRRTGILSVSAEDGRTAQVVLRAERAVGHALGDLIEQLRPIAQASAERLHYEFHESPAGRLAFFDGDEEADTELLRERRVLLVARDPVRSDALAQELRAHGAQVMITDGAGQGIERASMNDPEVVVLERSGMEGWALPAMRAIRRDPRARWASMLVLEGSELFDRDGAVVDLARFVGAMRPLLEADRELARRAAKGSPFETRLELVGPSRLVRALAATGLGLRVMVRAARVHVEVDLAEGLVVGARAMRPGEPEVIAQGPAALATLLGLRAARVRVEPKEAPVSTELMAPAADALAAAARERPAIAPSLPPPSVFDMPTVKKEGEELDARALLARFEALLERLYAEPREEPPTMRREAVPRAPANEAPKLTGPAPKVPRPQARAAEDDAAAPIPEPSAAAVPPPEVPPPREPAADPRVVDAKDAPIPKPSPVAAVPPPETPAAAVVGAVDAKDARVPPASAPPPRDDGAADPVAAAEDGADAPIPDAPPVAADATPRRKNRAVDPLAATELGLRDARTAAAPALADPTTAPAATGEDTSPAYQPPPRLASKHPTMTLGTVSAKDAALDSEPPPALDELEDGAIESAMSNRATIAMGSVGASEDEHGVRRRSSAPPPAGELEEIEAIAVPGKLTPPPSIGAAFVPQREPSDFGLDAVRSAGAPVAASAAEPGAIGRDDETPRDARPLPEARAASPMTRPASRPLVIAAATVAGLGVLAAVVALVMLAMSARGETPRVEAPVEESTRSTPMPQAAPSLPAPPVEPAAEPVLPPPSAEVAAALRAEDLDRAIQIANRHRRARELDAARGAYQHVLAVEPESPRALAGMAHLAMDQDDGATAARYARRLVEARPEVAANHVLLGDALALAGDPNAAREAYAAALDRSPRHEGARRRLRGR